MRSRAAQVLTGQRVGSGQDLAIGSLENHLAAGLAVAGSQIDDLVGRAHDFGLVFDDDDGVARVAQALRNANEASGVAGVQADAGFVKNEERVDQARPQAGGRG
jgi:hypothetical protein